MRARTRYPLAVQKGEGRTRQLSAERLVNMYAEQAPNNSRAPISARAVPGLQELNALEGNVRAFYSQYSQDTAFAVIDQTLYEINSDFTFIDRGTIAGFGRAGIVDNGTQLTIVTGRIGYVYTRQDGLQEIPNENFNGADAVDFMNGVFVYNNVDIAQRNQFKISEVFDGLTHDPLQFATAERFPDTLIRPFAHLSQLLLFGDRSIEIWFGVADLFPFAPAQGSAIEQGLGARNSIEIVDETVIWLDDEGIVRRLNGITPVRISTHAVEYQLTRGDWTNAFSWSYVEEGHQFYVLTVLAANGDQEASTQVYDTTTGLWHERRSYEKDFLDVAFYMRAYDRHLVISSTGTLYDLSLDHLDLAGDPLITEMQFPPANFDGRRFIVHSFQLDAEVGTLGRTTTISRGVKSLEWMEQGSPSPTQNDSFQAVAYGNDRFMSGLNDRQVSVSSDNGVTWAEHNVSGQAGFTTNDVLHISGDFWISSGGGSVGVSRDNGETWASFIVNGSLNFILLARNPTTGRVLIGTNEDGYYWTDDFPLTLVATGTHTGGDEEEDLEDSTQSFAVDALIGETVINLFTPSSAVITDNDVTTVVANLSGNTEWFTGDEYDIVSTPTFTMSESFVFNPDDGRARAMTFGNGLFVVGGEFGLLETSPDADMWTGRNSGLSDNINGVVYGNGTFVAVADNGNISTSSDGITWTALTGLPFGSDDLDAVSFGDGVFVVALNNQVGCSTDGQEWTLIDTPVSSDGAFIRTQDIAFGGDVFVLGADFSGSPTDIIFTSDPEVGGEGEETVTLENDAVLAVSDDGGHTYGFTQPVQSLGRRGEYTTRAKWNRLGQYDNSFTPRITASAAVQRTFMTAYMEVESCDE